MLNIPVRRLGSMPTTIEGESTQSRFLFARVAALRARQIYKRPTEGCIGRSPETVAMEETARGRIGFMTPDRVSRGVGA